MKADARRTVIPGLDLLARDARLEDWLPGRVAARTRAVPETATRRSARRRAAGELADQPVDRRNRFVEIAIREPIGVTALDDPARMTGP